MFIIFLAGAYESQFKALQIFIFLNFFCGENNTNISSISARLNRSLSNTLVKYGFNFKRGGTNALGLLTPTS